jgi:FKBP-type peptidyl-prolyl cis-trans isomerase FkpA
MSVTQVPIQPIKKGSLAKLWIGVGLCIVLAGGLAWAGTRKFVASGCKASDFPNASVAVTKLPSGLQYQVIRAGKGSSPTDEDVALVNYKGMLRGGKQFDAGQQVPFPVRGVIPGFTEALKKMQQGGSYHLCIPSNLGYGAASPGPEIPANSTLMFDVDLIAFMPLQQFQAMQQQMQAQQQAQGRGGAVPGAPPGR